MSGSCAAGALPRPLAGEGWGEGVSATGHSPRGESPHPTLRADLSRKRERCTTRNAALRINRDHPSPSFHPIFSFKNRKPSTSKPARSRLSLP
uniref:Uncharacterized protein n=1 Tax=Bradyrhizobium amphicarpaeae TaxID=1404768 RepID=A0A2U8Q1U4_9BRAD|nr:hypothetical protein CIT40_30380 [Bradyrhizobium amphicarpaeae]